MTSHITKRKIEKLTGRKIDAGVWEEFCSFYLTDVASCFLDCEPHAVRKVAEGAEVADGNTRRTKFRIVGCTGTEDSGDCPTGMTTTMTKADVERILAHHIDDRVWERFIGDDNERDQMERGLIDAFTHIRLIELAAQMETETGDTDIQYLHESI